MMTAYFDFIYGLSLGLQYIDEYIDENNNKCFVIVLDLICFRLCVMWEKQDV